MSRNLVVLLGRLGQDPELRYSASGDPVCNFSVATNEKWVDKDNNKQEKTEWHRITVWGKQGENCKEYLKAGSEVYLEGKLQTKEFKTKEGVEQKQTEIIARTVQFIGKGKDNG